MFLTTREEFKDYIFRRLGQDVHNVEISEDQFNDIFNDSLKELYEYSDDGAVEQIYVIENINKEKNLRLSNKVLSITNVYFEDPSSGVSYSKNQFMNVGIFHPILDVISGVQGQLSGYVLARQYINDVVQALKSYLAFRFNPETKALRLEKEIDGVLVIRAFIAEDEEYLYESKYLRMLVESKCWRQWSTNTSGKYKNIVIGNGLELNSERMDERADAIEEKLEAAKEGDEWGFMMPMTTTKMG